MERSLSTYVAYIERPDYPPYMEDEEYPRIREKYEKAKLSVSDSMRLRDGDA